MANSRTNFSIFWRKAVLLGVGLLLAQAALLAGGAFYQSAAAAADRRQFPPPGKLVELDGYRLHLNCTGQRREDTPTVIIEGGLGAPSLMWSLVQPSIAAYARVCSYDRAGQGWSEASPLPRTARPMMGELHDLLERAGETPPFILVGHSFGGVLMRVYATAYPADVAGLILVDARHEDYFQRMPADYLKTDENNLRRARWLRQITPFGLTRLAGRLGTLDTFETYLAPLPDDIEPAAWAMMIYNPQHWSISVAEREAIETSYQQVRATRLPEDLPLTVLTAEHGMEAWQPAAGATDAAARAIWMDLQAELAGLTAHGQWIIVRDSGHYIYFDQPQAIVEAVASMVKP